MNHNTTPHTNHSATAPAPSSGGLDLAVCYRVYPRISGKPIFGFTEKLDLVRLGLETFKQAILGLRVKLWVLLDNCPVAYRHLVESLLPECAPEFIALPGVGNEATFARQIEILVNQHVADLVYFAEDDYLYLPGAVEKAVAFMHAHPEADFVTLYDHPDYHNMYLHRIRGRQITEAGLRWRTVVSTCLTFMTRQAVLAETADVLRTYQRKNSDLGVWLALTKVRTMNPWSFIRSVADGAFIAGSYILAWRYCWRQILFGKPRTLWAPEPSLATHMESSGVAAGVDWQRIFGPFLR